MIIFFGIVLPFLGTSLGAAFVFFMKDKLNQEVNKALLGVASGIMVAASIWSLLIPSMEMSEHLKRLAFFPAAVGFFFGILFLLFLDNVISHMEKEKQAKEKELEESGYRKVLLLVIAIILHNIPEGMAVGAAFAGSLSSHTMLAGALALSLGIAIQNIPEGAIVSMPLRGQGMSRKSSFFYGVLSGIVEPIGAGLTLLLVGRIQQMLPFLLSFAAGCMIYVVVQELIPEAVELKTSFVGVLSFSIGFLLMMILDVAL